MSMRAAVLIGILAVMSTGVYASYESDLAMRKNCTTCHAPNKKMAGPSYRDIAAKYAKTPNAARLLANKISKGGSGVWGSLPMPPSTITTSEAMTLAKWILTFK